MSFEVDLAENGSIDRPSLKTDAWRFFTKATRETHESPSKIPRHFIQLLAITNVLQSPYL
jgi:hypothetical protein